MITIKFNPCVTTVCSNPITPPQNPLCVQEVRSLLPRELLQYSLLLAPSGDNRDSETKWLKDTAKARIWRWLGHREGNMALTSRAG